MDGKTILGKLGVSDKVVKSWKNMGLTVTFPIRQNPRYFKSADPEEFVENADKFVPQLSRNETELYTKYPEKFSRDFLGNLRFYKKFCNFVYQVQKRAGLLRGEERVAALLSLLFLFQRAMDYHYYHWDRYLVYENYPKTPLGYWWKSLEDLYAKATKERFSKQKPPEGFLKLLSSDRDALKLVEAHLTKNDSIRLGEMLRKIKIFEDAQSREARMIADYTHKTDILIGTGMPILKKFWKEVEKNPKLVKAGSSKRINRIRKLHPITGARRLLLTQTLKGFDQEVYSDFINEIKRWI